MQMEAPNKMELNYPWNGKRWSVGKEESGIRTEVMRNRGYIGREGRLTGEANIKINRINGFF